jgi:hypothetical protein
MGTDLFPYSFPTQLEPPSTLISLPGQCQGVLFTLSLDLYEVLLAKIEGWFADRLEVVLVDHGTTDKQGLGFLLLEWQECAIDPLFLAILRDEEHILDYTVYGRFLED